MTQSILATIITIHALLAGISPDYALCIVEHESQFDMAARGDGGKALHIVTRYTNNTANRDLLR
jgi:hypothetical protein